MFLSDIDRIGHNYFIPLHQLFIYSANLRHTLGNGHFIGIGEKFVLR